MAKELSAEPADLVFRALADPTRRRVIEVLASGQLPAGEIASRFTISAPSVSRHLGVLLAAGLVAQRREANRIIYSVVPERLASTAGAWLGAVCPSPRDEEAAAGALPSPSSEKPAKKKPSKAGGKRKRKAGGKKPPPITAPAPADRISPPWRTSQSARRVRSRPPS
jgi:DNA-binding transcriptional ArsR family regulator